MRRIVEGNIRKAQLPEETNVLSEYELAEIYKEVVKGTAPWEA